MNYKRVHTPEGESGSISFGHSAELAMTVDPRYQSMPKEKKTFNWYALFFLFIHLSKHDSPLAFLWISFTHAIFDVISCMECSLLYPARMLFYRSIAWIENEVIVYFLTAPLFPISGNLAVFCCSITWLKSCAGLAGAGFVCKIVWKSHRNHMKNHMFHYWNTHVSEHQVQDPPWISSPVHWSLSLLGGSTVSRSVSWAAVECQGRSYS